MTEQDKENLIATISGMNEEEMGVAVTCIPARVLGMELIARCEDAESFKRGILELLNTKK